jgi:hypothetical protein
MSASSPLVTVFKWIVLVILAVVALKMVFTVLGVVVFLGGVLLFKVLPLLVVGWLVLKVVQSLSDNGAAGAV